MQGRSPLCIIVVPTAECNADCMYCFMHHRPLRMSLETVERLFGQALEYCLQQGHDSLTFFWQGGEILVLEPDWFLQV